MLNQVNWLCTCARLNDFLQDFGIAIWLKYGAPAHKLVLGVPLFARSFLLAHSDQNDLHAPTVGNGTEGPFTRSAGFLSYFEVSDLAWVFPFRFDLAFDAGLSLAKRSAMAETYRTRWVRIGVHVQRPWLDLLRYDWKRSETRRVCRGESSGWHVCLVTCVEWTSRVAHWMSRSFLVDMDDFNGVFCHNGTYPYIKQSLALLPNHMPSYL